MAELPKLPSLEELNKQSNEAMAKPYQPRDINPNASYNDLMQKFGNLGLGSAFKPNPIGVFTNMGLMAAEEKQRMEQDAQRRQAMFLADRQNRFTQAMNDLNTTKYKNMITPEKDTNLTNTIQKAIRPKNVGFNFNLENKGE